MIGRILAALLILAAFAFPARALAADVDVFGDICQRANSLPGEVPAACADKNLGNKNPIYGPDGVVTKVFNIISILVGIAAVISIIIAATRFVTSGSNPEEVTKAREYIQYAFVGLVVAAAAQLIVRIVLARLPG